MVILQVAALRIRKDGFVARLFICSPLARCVNTCRHFLAVVSGATGRGVQDSCAFVRLHCLNYASTPTNRMDTIFVFLLVAFVVDSWIGDSEILHKDHKGKHKGLKA